MHKLFFYLSVVFILTGCTNITSDKDELNTSESKQIAFAENVQTIYFEIIENNKGYTEYSYPEEWKKTYSEEEIKRAFELVSEKKGK